MGGPIYCIALLGFKLTLLISYLRLASVSVWYRRVLWAIMFLVTANQIAFAFVLSFGCSPIAKQWDQTITEGKCINTLASYFGTWSSYRMY